MSNIVDDMRGQLDEIVAKAAVRGRLDGYTRVLELAIGYSQTHKGSTIPLRWLVEQIAELGKAEKVGFDETAVHDS